MCSVNSAAGLAGGWAFDIYIICIRNSEASSENTRLGLILPDHEFVRRDTADKTDRDECSDNRCKPAIARDVLTRHMYVHAPNTFIISSFSERVLPSEND